MSWVFLNGTFCKEKKAVISVTDRGFLFGDGMFTTIRVSEGKCELFDAHLKRLKMQAEALQFEWDAFQEEWAAELIRLNEAWKGTWRLKIIVTVKEEDAKTRKTGTVLATLHPYIEKGEKVCTLALFPYPIEMPFARVKSLSYLDHLQVRNFGLTRGYDDAVTTTKEGCILETGCSNLFWVDHGICFIPDKTLPYIQGVFLQALIPHIPFPVQYVKVTLDQIQETASVYMCNALTHVCPVVAIEKRVFPRTLDLEREFANTIYQK